MREVFENKLKEDRYDSFTRKAYADWLEEHGFDDEAVEQRRRALPEWKEAAEWMQNICEDASAYYHDLFEEKYTIEYCDEKGKLKPITFEVLIQAGYDYLEHGEFLIERGTTWLRSEVDSEKYWKNWSVITGKDPTKSAKYGLESPFSCSC